MMEVKAFTKKHIRISSKTSFMLESKTVHKEEEGEQ